MNVGEASGRFRRIAFVALRWLASLVPAGRISAFGKGPDHISQILVVNLDRQPRRWRRVLRELGRFRTSDGASLASLARRHVAEDARDGTAVAPSADVDTTYRLADQLFVQPDARLEECFGPDQTIRMSRQEVAVARSHIEVWKAVATGRDRHVLVLEDDVWFRPGAAAAIENGWRASIERCRSEGGPNLLYLSYSDAAGSAERGEVCEHLFRPIRGLWFLSGYVLSRDGAAELLRAMPVVGPVDMWMNNHLEALGALAITTPAILQRPDEESENSYSILPYLARAGIVDAGAGLMPPARLETARVFAWTARGEREGLAMALSMLGLRARVFDGNEAPILESDLSRLLTEFDALVDPPLAPCAIEAAAADPHARYVFETGAICMFEAGAERFAAERSVELPREGAAGRSWRHLCALLRLPQPAHAFPAGAPRSFRLFRDGRANRSELSEGSDWPDALPLDESAWLLPRSMCQLQSSPFSPAPVGDERIVEETLSSSSSAFRTLVETFPGNLASFESEGLEHREDGAHLVARTAFRGTRRYRSGAFASRQSFGHGRFSAEIKAASGPGLVTGFFLHRPSPRQEIDVEIAGDDPRCMLTNVYFNAGDDGTDLGFGYRGAPCRIELSFDATTDFHLFSIDWRPDRIAWLVDNEIVHERVSWEPTPIPHLRMRLHGNLWVPRSEELAGRIRDSALPAEAIFRNVSIC